MTELTEKTHDDMQAAGFTYEYPGFWFKQYGEINVTISDGESMNGIRYEVQATRDVSKDPDVVSEAFVKGGGPFASLLEAAHWCNQEFGIEGAI